MYQITHDYGKWGETEIEAHQNDIYDLLNQIPKLLEVPVNMCFLNDN